MNYINVDSPTIHLLYAWYSVFIVNPIIIITALILICVELGAIGLFSIVLLIITLIL